MYLVRARVLAAYGDEILLDPIDRKVGTAVLIFVLVVVTVGYLAADARHPVSVPLQAGEAKIKPLPIKPNPFLIAADHPLSTFAADVDTASYTNVRRFLAKGELPPADAVSVASPGLRASIKPAGLTDATVESLAFHRKACGLPSDV